MQRFTDWAWARDKVIFRLVSTEKNKKLLKDVPHYDIPKLKLSMTFYILMYTDGGMAASIQVYNSHTRMWVVSKEELLEYAENNTPKEMGFSMDSMMGILYGMEKNEMDGIVCPEGFPQMYVLSNKQKLYGAGCILYHGALEQAAERLGSGFYVLPSSVHEVILLPSDRQESRNSEELKGMVAEINRSDALPAEDVLTDEVYYYDREKHELAIAV